MDATTLTKNFDRVRVAVGRRYRNTAPLTGTLYSPVQDTKSVHVHVAPVVENYILTRNPYTQPYQLQVQIRKLQAALASSLPNVRNSDVGCNDAGTLKNLPG